MRGEDPEGMVHRYFLGLYKPTSIDDTNQLGNPSVFATYSLNFLEKYEIGVIYKSDVVDVPFPSLSNPDATTRLNKFGVAGQAYVGPLIANFGYFFSESTNDKDRYNVMGELLWLPTKKWLVAGRLDHLDQEDTSSGTRYTVAGRYNILPSVFLQIEYRNENAFNDGADSQKGRGFLVALF